MDYFGRSKLKILTDILDEWSAKRILLVTGKRSFDESPKKEELLSLLSVFEIRRHKDFDVNPNYEDILEGNKIVHDYNPDVIIGIGGGSVLDTAKLLSILPPNENEVKNIIKTSQNIIQRTKKLILIPTTAGSGSEATHFAVCYIQKEKFSVASQNLLPDAVILDSELTDTLPKSLTAISAFDALSQSIESIWAVGANKESISYAAKALKIMVPILPQLFENPTAELRDEILIASNLAGKAINISKTTGPHALSYGLTQIYGVPHGLAVMLLLPIFIIWNTDEKNINKLRGLNNNQFIERNNLLYKSFKVDNSDDFVNKIRHLIICSSYSIYLRDYGLKTKSSALALIKGVNKSRLSNNPVILSNHELLSMLLKII